MPRDRRTFQDCNEPKKIAVWFYTPHVYLKNYPTFIFNCRTLGNNQNSTNTIRSPPPSRVIYPLTSPDLHYVYINSSKYTQLIFICISIAAITAASVQPVLWIPNQLVGVARGMDVTLECHTEAFPRSINYWTDEKGQMILSSEYRLMLSDGARKS